MNLKKGVFDVRHFQGKINIDMNDREADDVANAILSQPPSAIPAHVWSLAEQLRTVALNARRFMDNGRRDDDYTDDDEYEDRFTE